MVDPTAARPDAVPTMEPPMRAERDEDEIAIRPRKEEPRLAYEIALGIIIGGAVLWTMGEVASFIEAKLMMQQLQIRFGG